MKKEISVVVIILVLVHTFFWLRCLPLPHIDLPLYTEPAFLLAAYSNLSAPIGQYYDLSYNLGYYGYLPGYYLILGSWIKVFGFSVYSLLSYTHAVHVVYLVLLWVLLRKKFGCDRWASMLAVFSTFPMFNHGRPDFTALTLAALAWLILPKVHGVFRLLVSGILLGVSILVSLQFGLSSLATLVTYLFFEPELSISKRVRNIISLIGSAVATSFISVLLVLHWQDAWAIAPSQFLFHLFNRGCHLNNLPGISFHFIIFSIFPLGVLIVLPVIWGLILTRANLCSTYSRITFSFFAGSLAWFVLSKAPFLAWGHFILLARPIFHGVFVSEFRHRFSRILASSIVIAYGLLHVYHQKDIFLMINSDIANSYKQLADLKLDPNQIALIDSHVFPVLYRPGKTLNYMTFKFENKWREALANTPLNIVELLHNQNIFQPLKPNLVVISAYTVVRTGPIEDSNLCINLSKHIIDSEKISFFGHRFDLAANPLKPFVFTDCRAAYPKRD